LHSRLGRFSDGKEAMMKHLMRTLSKLSAVAAVLGVAACAESPSQQAVAPAPAYAAQPQPQSQTYGSAMGQGVAPGTEMAPPGAPPPGGIPAPGDQYGAPSAQYGAPPQYGAPGQYVPQPGAAPPPYGAPGETAPQPQPGAVGAQPGAMGAPPPIPGTGGTTGGTGATGGPGATGAAGGTLDVSTLNDSQLAAVIQAIHQGQVQEAQLAQSRAMSPEVKRLAEHLMTSHQAGAAKDQVLFTRLQITPSDNSVSQQLSSDAQNEVSTLQGMRGRDFDRDFVLVEIKGHNQAIELIDRMIPNVRNPELKAELQNLRPRLEAHLREAERVQSAMQKGTTSKQGSKVDGGLHR
jgi:putative membrane protein